MKDNKQSSVELFAIALYEGGYLQGNGDEIDDLLVYFKAMHKEEIMDAHIEGQRVFDKFPHTQWTNDQAEQYYNETFNLKDKWKPTLKKT